MSYRRTAECKIHSYFLRCTLQYFLQKFGILGAEFYIFFKLNKDTLSCSDVGMENRNTKKLHRIGMVTYMYLLIPEGIPRNEWPPERW